MFTVPASVRQAPIETQIAWLVDIEELKQLKARYCQAVDAEDWPAFRSLFVDHARFRVVEVGEIVGADVFLAQVISRHGDGARMRTVHQCHTPVLQIDGDRAEGTWAMFDYVDRIGTDGVRRITQGYGYYDETYERTPQGWRIATLHIRRLRIDDVDAATATPFDEHRASGA